MLFLVWELLGHIFWCCLWVTEEWQLVLVVEFPILMILLLICCDLALFRSFTSWSLEILENIRKIRDWTATQQKIDGHDVLGTVPMCFGSTGEGDSWGWLGTAWGQAWHAARLRLWLLIFGVLPSRSSCSHCRPVPVLMSSLLKSLNWGAHIFFKFWKKTWEAWTHPLRSTEKQLGF